MRIKNLILVSLAVLMAVVSCKEKEENLGMPSIKLDGNGTMTFETAGGDQQINLTATRDWMVETDAEWIMVSPESGKASATPQTVTVTALENKGMDRTADVKFTIGMSFQTLTVNQAGPDGSVENLIVYSNNFDKEKAEKTYGSGSSYPYLDQFDGWMNATGTGAANVTYNYKGMSTRSNSTSDSNYSDYQGSGVNNLFFGSNAYFAIKNISLSASTGFTLSFGTEKYDGNNKDALFDPAEFHVYLSNDGAKWVELEYEFAGTAAGRWNVASTSFSVPAGTESLSICVKADAASVYRMDDLQLVLSEGGDAVDFSKGVEMDFGAGTAPGGGNEGGSDSDATAIYHNNFDKTISSKVNDKWPFLDQFDGWMNAAGTGAADVVYKFKSASARASSDNNNIWLPKTGAYFSVQGIALNGTTDLKLSFNVICGSPGSYKKSFSSSVFKVYVSSDNAKWVELACDVTANDKEFDNAVTTFSVPANTASLSIAFEKIADETDGYRIDDVKLAAASAAGTAVDFSQGVSKDFGAGGSDEGGSDEGNTGGGEGGTDVVVAKSIETGDYWIMTADKSEVVIPIDDQGKGYGYWNVEAASNGTSTAENAFTFTWVEGKGYTIQDSEGRYHYMTTYNSFSISTSEQNDGSHYWAVTANTDGTYSIVNTVSGKTVQMSSHGNFCPYTDVTGDLPTLVKAEGSDGGEVTPPAGGDEGGNEGDNPGGEGDNPGGEVTPPADETTPMTIAEVLASGSSPLASGSYIEAVVISDRSLNNLTSKKGLYVQDATAGLQFYLAENHEFNFGDKVKIDLSGVKVGGYNGAVQISGLALANISVISTGNAVEPKTVTVADFLANKYEGQYVAIEGVQVVKADLAKTFVEGDAHTSINLETADGKTFAIFSSKYASYGAEKVPQGSGTIKGISSISNGAMQIIFAKSSDYAGLTGERFGDNAGGDEGGEVTPPAGGDEGGNEGGEGDNPGGEVTPPAGGDEGGDHAGVWSYTFEKGDLGEDGSPKSSVTLNDVLWSFNMEGSTYLGYDSQYGRGVQMGKSKQPASTIILSTEGITGTVKKIIVNTSGASKTDASLAITVGGAEFGSSIQLTQQATVYTLEGSASGKIELTWTLTTAAVYINSIEIYTE